MANVNNMPVRRNNINDPIGNPVWFLKNDNRAKESAQLLSLSKFEHKINDKYS